MLIYSFQELHIAILEGTGTYSPLLLAPTVGLGALGAHSLPSGGNLF